MHTGRCTCVGSVRLLQLMILSQQTARAIMKHLYPVAPAARDHDKDG